MTKKCPPKWPFNPVMIYLDAAHIASRPPTIGQWSNFLQNGTFSISLSFIFSPPKCQIVVFCQLLIFANKKVLKSLKVFLSFKIQWHEFYWLVIPYVLIVQVPSEIWTFFAVQPVSSVLKTHLRSFEVILFSSLYLSSNKYAQHAYESSMSDMTPYKNVQHLYFWVFIHLLGCIFTYVGDIPSKLWLAVMLKRVFSPWFPTSTVMV